MADQESMTRLYHELLDQIKALKEERMAMLRAALSEKATERWLFDEVAFRRLGELEERVDEELVELENVLPDDLPDCRPGDPTSENPE